MKMSSAKLMTKEKMSKNYDFFFSSQPSRTKFFFIIQLTLLTFAFANSTSRTSESATEHGLVALNNMRSQAHAIAHELNRLQVHHSGMALKVCHEVVSHSIRHLDFVQDKMDLITMTSDDATSAKMAVTAANTYLRTCQQALAEAGEKSYGSFSSVMSLLAAAGTDQCSHSQIISQAITTMGKDSPKQELVADRDQIILAAPESIIDSIPATRRVRVAKDGSGNYTTINDAVQNVPINQNSYFLIYIDEGTYEEYVNVSSDHPYLIMVGAGEGKTIITGNRSNVTGYGTFYSATLAIDAEHFIGFNFTVENTAGPQNFQAVALRTSGSFSAFYHCTILGFQDTLFVHLGYQFFRECTIAGTIDFIFGDSSVVLQSCTIVLRPPLEGQANVIAASDRNCPTDLTGISIHMSSVIASPDLKSTTVSYLGRPWGNYARSAFLLCKFTVPIDPSRWCHMNGSPANVVLGEYGNSSLGGSTDTPGNTTLDRKLDQNSAYQFTVDKMLLGGDWIGSMTVPYTKGLTQ